MEKMNFLQRKEKQKSGKGGSCHFSPALIDAWGHVVFCNIVRLQETFKKKGTRFESCTNAAFQCKHLRGMFFFGACLQGGHTVGMADSSNQMLALESNPVCEQDHSNAESPAKSIEHALN